MFYRMKEKFVYLSSPVGKILLKCWQLLSKEQINVQDISGSIYIGIF